MASCAVLEDKNQQLPPPPQVLPLKANIVWCVSIDSIHMARNFAKVLLCEYWDLLCMRVMKQAVLD